MSRYTHFYQSPMGRIMLGSDGESLIGTWFETKRYFDDKQWADSKERMLPVFEQTVRWLDCYFEGKDPGFMPPVRLVGTPFRVAVWKILKTIPYGTTVTYNDIAREIARQRNIPKMAAQAVGGAVGHNPVSIIVPCHRVVGANGSLTGYGGGIQLKVKLLSLEGVDMKKLFVPTRGTAL